MANEANSWNKRVFLVWTLSTTTLSAPVLWAQSAETEVYELQEIVLTAPREETLLDTPGGVSVITTEDLREMGAKNVIEALERVPGVYNTSAGGTSLSVRGTRSSMAGGPVILVDGVVQTYGNSRREELELIPVSQVARIEVLRSPGIVYGPGAARGVINIITQRNESPTPLAARVASSHGSWQTSNLSGALSGRWQGLDYYGSAAHLTTSGYDHEEQHRSGLLFRGGYSWADQTRLGLRSSWMTHRRQSSYGLSRYRWQLENYGRSLHFPRSEQDSDLVWHNAKAQHTGLVGIEFAHRGKRFRLKSNVSYTRYGETYDDTKDIMYSPKNTRGDRDKRAQDTYTATISSGYGWQWGWGSYEPLLGFSLEYVDYTNRRTYPYDSAEEASTKPHDIDLQELRVGLYLDNELQMGKRWRLSAGIRIDYMSLNFQTLEPWSFDSRDRQLGAFSALTFQITERAKTYLSFSRNHWHPTPRYFQWAAEYDTESNRPEDLRSEKAMTLEVGYKQLLSRAFSVSVCGYLLLQDDKFSSFYEDGEFSGVKNIGETQTLGVELEAQGRVTSWLGYRFAGSFIKAEWRSAQQSVYAHPSNEKVIEDLRGQRIHGIPRLTYHAGLDLFPWANLKGQVTLNGYGSYGIDYLNRLEYPPKVTLDVMVSYAWRLWRIWLLGKNVTNTAMERPVNSSGRLTGEGGEPRTSYYVLDGLYLELGLSASY